ncbi:MAG: formyltetrahydrofolate deformylase [Alcanivoracaceae bacterium]|nr:formyltetrahydrofolate deformylase [Alcanivoracaceae bacterium]
MGNTKIKKTQNTVRILIDCEDAKGLIYKVSKIFFERDLNIDSNQEFVEKDCGRFFMRTVVSGDFSGDELEQSLLAVIPATAHLQVIIAKKRKIVLLVTKESHALGDILIRHAAGEFDADIQAVIGNHKNLQQLVERFDIPFHHVSAQNLTRQKHEKKVMKVINEYQFDYIVLAKYMRILTADFVDSYPQQIINIHHSFLPAFIGANPYKQAFDRGVKIIGATAHFVTSDLDEGPIIAQNIIPVNHRFDWRDMQKAGRDVEKSVLSRALALVLNDRVFIHGNKTIVF